MKKKLLSALLSVAMVSTLLVGCGSNAEAPAADAATDAEAPAASTTDPIYVYSWNTEVGERMAYVFESILKSKKELYTLTLVTQLFTRKKSMHYFRHQMLKIIQTSSLQKQLTS